MLTWCPFFFLFKMNEFNNMLMLSETWFEGGRDIKIVFAYYAADFLRVAPP
jgi:hypothetical protein